MNDEVIQAKTYAVIYYTWEMNWWHLQGHGSKVTQRWPRKCCQLYSSCTAEGWTNCFQCHGSKVTV